MQRIIRRAEQNRRALRQKFDKKVKEAALQKSGERREQSARFNAVFRRHRNEARRNRQVDWATGGLAPRRDVGEQAERYATLSTHEMHAPETDESRRLKWWPLAVGDRVVVMRGRDEGQIGTVVDLDKAHNAVSLRNMNVYDVFLTDWMRREEAGQKQAAINPMTFPFPVQDVRLVYPLPHPETGEIRDVIIEGLEQVQPETDDVNVREDAEERGERCIAGTNTIIPWPAHSEREHADNEDDTLRINVDEQTFRPALLQYPFPPSVIDELRSKYSKIRKRHDWDYTQRKSLEDVSVEKKAELQKTMRTPLQELAELRVRQKKAAERELSPEQLAKIGEVIALQRAKGASGTTDLGR